MFAKREGGALEGWGDVCSVVDLQISWFLSEITVMCITIILLTLCTPRMLRYREFYHLTMIVCFWHLRPKFEVQSMHTFWETHYIIGFKILYLSLICKL